jgi:UDP-N-acetylglucosamine--N-acetylmuramyl-(pentapeptide) pyrophosphoryl-undecaprenol N-acetylglucosamine transferase
MTVLMAAGGTGGHLIPAIVVADALKKKLPDAEVFFAVSGKELEEKILSSTPYSVQVFEGDPLVGQGVLRKLYLISMFLPRLFRSIRIVKSFRVRVVVGFGGYPSVLPVLSAWFLGIPVIIFEQNGKAGLANRGLAFIAKKVFAVPGSTITARHVDYILNPVRSEIKEVPIWQLPAADEPLQILIIGGSQGAVRVNSAILSMLSMFKNYPVRILHQTGEKDFARVLSAYQESGVESEVLPYIQDMKEAYARSHIVICRAGAGSVSEVITARRPAIFIPLAISHGHQYFNVKELLSFGAAHCVTQDEHLDEQLKLLLQSLLESPARLQGLIDALDKFQKEHSFRDGTDALSEAVLEFYDK